MHTARSMGAATAAALTAGAIAMAPGVASASTPSAARTTGTQAVAKIPAKYLNQTLDWQICQASTGTECALITMPLDWNNMNAGRDIKVAVSRTVPEGSSKARLVIGNPGGPGAPGLGMAPYLASMAGMKDHVAVGFDPRGTGSSTNISCAGAPGYTMDARDRDQFTLDLVAKASRLWNDYCLKGSGGMLDYVNTWQTVHDIDLIRQLLGFTQTDWVGYSGGTWMGAYYQKQFPASSGRFVLDSNTDFTRPWNVTFEAQPESFQVRFEQDFQRWAAKYDEQLHLGATRWQVNQFYDKLRADLKRKPIEFSFFGMVFVINQNTLDSEIISSMYTSSDFQTLAEDMLVYRQWWDEDNGQRSGNGQKMASLPKAQQERILAAIERSKSPHAAKPVAEDAFPATFTAITCNDTVWPRGQRYADTLSGKLGSRYPLVGWSINQNPCYYWQRPALTMPTPDGKGAGTTLMVQSVHDPATNARLAYDAHARYEGSRLITVRNWGDHGVYGGGIACVDETVDTFLATGKAPARDKGCVGPEIPGPSTRGPALAPNPLKKVSELGSAIAVG